MVTCIWPLPWQSWSFAKKGVPKLELGNQIKFARGL